jgi:hypothetical protein
MKPTSRDQRAGSSEGRQRRLSKARHGRRVNLLLLWGGLTLLGGGGPLAAQPALRDKWLQVPDTTPNGIDVRVTDQTVLADDFRCSATGPITEIRIWGSWLNDLVFSNACFCLGLWTDIPTNAVNLHSQPGQMLCQTCFYPGEYTSFLYTNVYWEQFWDPFNPVPGLLDSQVWEYRFQLPTNVCWVQTNGNIYWLSVTIPPGCFDPHQYQFGWKTCPTNWNDDAVFGDSPGFGTPPPFWMELRRPPFYTNSLDLAFEIITTQTNPPPPPTNTIAQKWLQVPDTSMNGLDVKATDPKILADDFRCTATGPITQIRIWTSWLFDLLPPQPPCFSLGIWTDIPTNANVLYSRPGTLLCNWQFPPGTYTNFLYTNGVQEQFFDPNLPAIIGSDTMIWEYVFDLPTNNPCWQTNGNIYWLSVQADCFDTQAFLFGWKTCPTNWNDDAVFGDSPGFGTPPPFWMELRRPPFYTNSLDLAFEIITSQTNPCPPGITIACDTNQVVECGTYWTISPPTVSTPCCGTNYTLTLSTATNGTCPQVITYTWIAIDCAGATAACTHTVTIVDTTKPVLTCAPNKTVQCSEVWNFDPPTAYDACCGTNVTVTIQNTTTNGICPQLITREWLATDCCTNSTLCSQTVTVTDTNQPMITCPSNILVWSCSTNVAVTWSLTATDLCSSVTVTSLPPSGSFFNRDTTNTIMVIATDACGNSNSCAFLVIVHRPALSLTISGSPPVITITWPDGGILQETTNLISGPWTDLPLATSPYTVTPAGSQRFYRLRCP